LSEHDRADADEVASWLHADGEVDFLSFATRDTDAGRDQIERARRPLARWVAEVLAQRHPEVAPMRGIKGLRILESDVDVLLRRLAAACEHDDVATLRDHAQWYRAVVRGRPRGEAALDAAVGVLAEGLLRFLGASAGARAARLLLLAHESAAPDALRPWLTARP
jgi:hypothetical protein